LVPSEWKWHHAAMSSSTEDRAAPVSSPRLRLLARVIFGLTILGIAAGVWFSVLDTGKFETDLAFLLSFCLFPIIGYILAIRRPDNAISWLMLGIGAAFGLGAFVGSYASYAIHGGVGGFGLGAIALAFDQPMWIPIVGCRRRSCCCSSPTGTCRRRGGGGSPGSWASAW
jgi:hypothetical protein